MVSGRAWVEWEAREAVKLNLSVNSGRDRSLSSRVANEAGLDLFEAQRTDNAVPSVHFSLRFNR